MSDLVKSIFTKEQLWANHSRRSLQKSYMSEKRAMWVICLRFEWNAHKKQVIRLKNYIFCMFFNSFPPFYAQGPIAPITLAHSLFYLLKNHQVNRYFTKKTSDLLKKPKSKFPTLPKSHFFQSKKAVNCSCTLLKKCKHFSLNFLNG